MTFVAHREGFGAIAATFARDLRRTRASLQKPMSVQPVFNKCVPAQNQTQATPRARFMACWQMWNGSGVRNQVVDERFFSFEAGGKEKNPGLCVCEVVGCA